VFLLPFLFFIPPHYIRKDATPFKRAKLVEYKKPKRIFINPKLLPRTTANLWVQTNINSNIN
jgi:hypothetical protein